MKSVAYEDWKAKRRAGFVTAVDVENTFGERRSGGRERDPAKEKILITLEKARRDRYVRSGKLTILGPRLWKWRINFSD